jgi:hypothetical protein
MRADFRVRKLKLTNSTERKKERKGERGASMKRAK